MLLCKSTRHNNEEDRCRQASERDKHLSDCTGVVVAARRERSSAQQGKSVRVLWRFGNHGNKDPVRDGTWLGR